MLFIRQCSLDDSMFSYSIYKTSQLAMLPTEQKSCIEIRKAPFDRAEITRYVLSIFRNWNLPTHFIKNQEYISLVADWKYAYGCFGGRAHCITSAAGRLLWGTFGVLSEPNFSREWWLDCLLFLFHSAFLLTSTSIALKLILKKIPFYNRFVTTKDMLGVICIIFKKRTQIDYRLWTLWPKKVTIRLHSTIDYVNRLKTKLFYKPVSRKRTIVHGL